MIYITNNSGGIAPAKRLSTVIKMKTYSDDSLAEVRRQARYVNFSTVLLSEGYRREEVDAFIRELRTADPSVNASQIDAVQFSPVFWGKGYNIKQVDDFLQQVKSLLEH